MPNFKTISDLSLAGKTVLVRADLNVPMQDGAVTDNTRMTRFIPTLRALMAAKAKIIVMSHFGRPKGQRNPGFSLCPVGDKLSELLGTPIAFADDCVGEVAQNAAAKLEVGQILLLENTRFHDGESANDMDFAKQLASLADIYINDAFPISHRAHASTAAVAKLLPCAAGPLMQEELNALSSALDHPQTPVAAIIGGAKISTKLDVLHNIVKKTQLLVLGGGMANTFLAAQGINVGKSLYEPDMLDIARTISAEAEASGCRILLPTDVVIASELKENIETQTVLAENMPSDKKIFDVGPETVADIKKSLDECRTLIWNGPLGVFEIAPFNQGTDEIAQHVAALTDDDKILSVAGGGDTVSALSKAGVTDALSYISTAGGAFLEWMEGKDLPGVTALSK